MALCPYCRQEWKQEKLSFYLPPRQKAIYRAVSSAGPKGILPVDLMIKMYDGNQPTPAGPGVMRVQIHELNKKIHQIGQHIKGGRHYRLIEA